MRAIILPSFLTRVFTLGIPPDSNSARYPSSDALSKLKASAVSFGAASCTANSTSNSCVEYQKYWSHSSDSDAYNLQINKDEDFDKAKKLGFGKLLIISAGQTFRTGGRFNVDAGTSDSLEPQHDAVKSHMAFARYLHERYNITTDFIVETYRSNHCVNEANCALTEWYPNGSTIKVEEMITPETDLSKRAIITAAKKSVIGYERLLNLGISRIRNLADYGAVFFIRADLKLKPSFFHYFDLFDRITFSFICESRANKLEPSINGNLRPQIGDMLAYVPRKHFNVFRHKGQFKLYHDAYNFYRANTIGFMVNTYHTANSQNYENPLYDIVNRPASNDTEDVGRDYNDFDGIWTDDPAFPKLTDKRYVVPWSATKKIAVAGVVGTALLGAAALAKPEMMPWYEKPRPQQPPKREVVGGSSSMMIVVVVLLVVLLALLIWYYYHYTRHEDS